MNAYSGYPPKPCVKEALLESGKVVRYDIACRDKYAVKDKNYRLLGKGTMFTINGVRQTNDHPMWFWERIT